MKALRIMVNSDILKNHYRVELIGCRQLQLKIIGLNFSSILDNKTPRHLLLVGEPGTGKSITARFSLEEIQKNSNNALTAYVNCREENTPTSALRKIFSQISQTELASGGISLSVIYNLLGRLITSKDKIIVICLDNINHFKSRGGFNNTISRLLEMHNEFPGTRISIIAIVNDLSYDLRTVLDASTYDLFQHSTIEYPAYTPDELSAILEEKARIAFAPDAMSPEIKEEIIKTAYEIGNLPIAMDFLCNCGMHAELEGNSTIEKQNIRAALAEITDQHLHYAMRNTITAHRDILKKIVVMNEQEPEILMARAVYRAMAHENEDIFPYSTFSTYLYRLQDLGLIEIHKKTRSGKGKVLEIVPRYPADAIKDACDHYSLD